MKKKSISLARAFPALLLCLLFLIPAARADIGPKPEVTITVVNAPEGELYLDLLAEGEPSHKYFDEADESKYDPAILARLRSLEGNGWVLAYTTGVSGRPPVFGDARAREDGTWHFSYTGLPSSFRIAAATAGEARAAEAPYTRDYFANIVYDWEANTVRDVTAPPLRFLTRLLTTLVPTLIIEGAIFWLFRYRARRSWLVFLAVNVATQAGLHLVLSTPVVLAGQHPLYYAVVFVPSELVIFAVEAAVYALFLREQTRKQRIGHAALANLASAVLGYFPLHLLYDFLMSL